MTRRTCNCASCRARTDDRFWRIIHAADPLGGWQALCERAATQNATPLAARGGRYGMPPIPTWEGEPAEWGNT